MSHHATQVPSILTVGTRSTMDTAVTSAFNPATRPVRPTVLLLDDEASVRESLGRYLQASGYDVLTADNADDAFGILRHSAISAAILDVRLPGDRSGLEVLEFMRLDEDWRELPVIILTGVQLTPGEEDIVRRCRAHVFYKPCRYGELVRHLSQLLRRI